MCFNALVSSTLLASSALVARGVTPSPQSSSPSGLLGLPSGRANSEVSVLSSTSLDIHSNVTSTAAPFPESAPTILPALDAHGQRQAPSGSHIDPGVLALVGALASPAEPDGVATTRTPATMRVVAGICCGYDDSKIGSIPRGSGRKGTRQGCKSIRPTQACFLSLLACVEAVTRSAPLGAARDLNSLTSALGFESTSPHQWQPAGQRRGTLSPHRHRP